MSKEAENGDFEVNIQAQGLNYTNKGTCLDGTFSDGELGGTLLFQGYDDLGGFAGLARNLQITNSYHVSPAVSTDASTGVEREKATVEGTVNPNLLSTTYQFEYGMTTAYGLTAPVPAKSVGSGQQSINVSQALEGLIPGQLYHYRISATNSEGTSYGEDKTFTTIFSHMPLLEAEKYPAVVSGSQAKQQDQRFTFAGGAQVACNSLQQSGSVSAATASLSLKTAPSSCLFAGLSATWDMKSCSYKLNILNSGPPYTAGMDISCSTAGDEIIVKATGCTVKVPPQSGLKGVGLANSGAGSERSVTLTYNVTGITYKQEGLACPKPGAGTYSDGSYTGSTKLSGLDEGGKADGIYLSGEGTQGLFVVGKESGEEANKPKVEAEKYPAVVSGSQAKQQDQRFTFAGGAQVACNSLQQSGSVSAATASLSLKTAPSSCLFAGLSATWDMKSCSYKLNILNSGPPYTAGMDISCSTAGDEIIVKATGCTVKVPPQSGLKGVGLANSGAGSERSVTLTYNVTGITYKQEGLACPKPGAGTYSDGSYTGSTKLLGFN